MPTRIPSMEIPQPTFCNWNRTTITEMPLVYEAARTKSDNGNTGANIVQLEPQEESRDGFSIRVLAKELTARREKKKFLLIFSDGEPAASGYDQNGIVDTNVAVAEARKKGIDVIGMFLSDGEVTEHEDETMKNIYGKERLMIPSVAELPEHFAPILRS